MTPTQRRYYSYLLRVWQVDGAGSPIWRASLEDVQTGERKGFADLESLFAFLKEQMSMLNHDPNEKMNNSNYLDIYKELCNSYRAIDDFRAKLLALLPLATGAGVAFLLGNITPENEKYLEPLGFFGFVITFGLFAYEIFGIHKCHALIKTGKLIEIRGLNVDAQFKSRPPGVLGLIDEPFAAGIIYPAVLASWMYIALVFSHPQASLPAAVIIFFAGFVGMIAYKAWLRFDGRKIDEQLQEEMKANPPKEPEWSRS